MTFLGLGRVTWFNIALNALFGGLNALIYSGNPNLASAMAMGFHGGLIVAAIIIDRVFLEDMRRETILINEYLADLRSLQSPSKSIKQTHRSVRP